MTYTWQEIEEGWLGGAGGMAASPDEVLSAFNDVCLRFGKGWIEASRVKNDVTGRGIAPTLYIVTLARLLQALNSAPNATRLIEKVRQGNPDSRAELIAIYLLRAENPNALIEVEPEIRVGTRNRMPDFRARVADEPWTYVEVTNPNTSDAQADVLSGLDRLTRVVDGCSRSFALEVFLKRDPTDAELDLIATEIRQRHQTSEQSTYELPVGLGTLYWNHHPPGTLVLDDHGEPYTPRLGNARVFAGDGEHRHIIARWPFTDKRAAAFIDHEARQLSTEEPGLIMIFTSGTVGAMNAWRVLIERRLQPNLNTRVSAVCLFSSSLQPTEQGEDWQAECKVILNPHARHPLPSWIADQFRRFQSNKQDS
jgi:hypothetical protein